MVLLEMDFTDIVKEIKEDYREIITYLQNKEKKITREILRRTVFPFSFPTTNYKSRNNNKWVVSLKIESRKFQDQKICCYCIVESDRGHYIIRPSVDNEKLIYYVDMFSPHVFARYRDRLNIDLNGLELVEHFFDKNSSYYANSKYYKPSTIRPRECYATAPEEIYTSMPEGVCLGECYDGVNVFLRTFITYDMLKGEQIEQFNATNEMRIELQDNYHPTKAQILSGRIHD